MSCLCGGYLRKSGRQLKRYTGETTLAKSKVAPMLVMSLTRLELEAARLLGSANGKDTEMCPYLSN